MVGDHARILSVTQVQILSSHTLVLPPHPKWHQRSPGSPNNGALTSSGAGVFTPVGSHLVNLGLHLPIQKLGIIRLPFAEFV